MKIIMNVVSRRVVASATASARNSKAAILSNTSKISSTATAVRHFSSSPAETNVTG